MSPSHTPGPWQALVSGCTRAIATSNEAPKQATICRLFTESDSFVPGEPEANALLIASAPELLAALAGCADALREAGKDFAQANRLAARPNLYELHERAARAAIAKAKGGAE